MFGWYKLRKFYAAGQEPKEWWDRSARGDSGQWDDPEEYRKQLFYPLLSEYLEPDKKYIDVQCGLGGWTTFLRARGFDIEGIETSKEAIELIQKVNPLLPVKQSDLTSLPYQDGSLDGYISIGGWEFLEDATRKLTEEASRVLKSDGVLLLEIPYSNPLRRWTYLPLKSLEVFVRSKLMGQPATFAYHMYRKGDILDLLRVSGFELVAMNPHDLPAENSHYGLWTDWPLLRGARPYELNGLGLMVKRLANMISPWMIATGMFVVAKKK